jgi:16S rRNA (adenine1518-N6/adenine1519-N6)-dimethyltransferase
MNPRALLGARGLRPKKSLGQNFLMDAGTSGRIARLTVDAPAQRVLEVGAGTGSLTAALLACGADLTAFDLDDALVDILRSRDDLAAARIEHGDALAYDYGRYAGAEPWRVAGNLPYNIATPLLILLAQMEHPPDRIVAMIQKDVADRLLAHAGTAAYGSLTIALSLTMRIERAFNVAPGQFFPRPKVTSSVVVLHRRDELAAPVRDRQRFEQVVRGAFAYRRKTLVNSLVLALELSREQVVAALSVLDLDPDIRGEQLDLATFAALTAALDR